MIAIYRLTLLEAARRRLLWALAALTLLSVVVTGWGLARLVEITRADVAVSAEIALGVSQVLILVAFMFSFVLAMTGAFLAAPAIGGELESGVALAVLARPIRRADVVLGKWLGLSTVVAGYAVVSGLAEIAVVDAVTGYAPPDPLGATLLLAAAGILLLTFTLLLSTRLSGVAAGAVSVVVYGLAWMVGVLGGVGAFFEVPALQRAADVANVLLPTDLLWRGTVFALEPPAVIFIAAGRAGRALEANPFYADAPVAPAALAWCAIWLAVIVGLTIVSLLRREA